MIETSRPQTDATEPLRSPEVRGPQSPETRLDPVTGQWTIFAPHRSNRPEEFVAAADVVKTNLKCPFCSGNEDETLPPVWVGRIDDGVCQSDIDCDPGADWAVRVVPNLYPAVEADATRTAATECAPLFQRQAVYGGHEVVIESRQHTPSFSNLDLSEIQLTFLAYRDRIRYWREVPGVAYISVFKNVGEKAGASLRHCHSQLIATDRVPSMVETAVKRMHRHRAQTGCCLHCDLIRGEQKAKTRVVWQDSSLIAFCPFASRLPMLLRITSLRHQSRYDLLDEAQIESVSRLVQRAVGWLETIRPATAYNVVLSSEPPSRQPETNSFHWTIDLFPRMTQLAGFEWSSGWLINPMLPESAAESYRKIVAAENPRTVQP
jgi:UDPglucose--hexose-1-phosphate uridylyltransferase